MDLADVFAAQQSSAVKWAGRTVHSVVTLRPAAGQISIAFREHAAVPEQGLALRVDEGMLTCNGVTSKHFTLWAGSTPPVVEVSLVPSKRASIISIWNIWRMENSITQAWLGNAAMDVSKLEDHEGLLVRCSDGIGEVNFADLVAEVRYLR